MTRNTSHQTLNLCLEPAPLPDLIDLFQTQTVCPESGTSTTPCSPPSRFEGHQGVLAPIRPQCAQEGRGHPPAAATASGHQQTPQHQPLWQFVILIPDALSLPLIPSLFFCGSSQVFEALSRTTLPLLSETAIQRRIPQGGIWHG